VRRGILITILAVVAFVVIVVARLPASWVIPTSPGAFSCASLDGSIWNGTCSGLVAQGTPIGDLTWDMHVLRLFTGKLSANIVLNRPTGTVSGDFAVGFDKNLSLSNVQAALPLDRELVALVAPGMRTPQGSIQANIDEARITKNNIVTDIKGTIEVHDLVTHDPEPTAWGSYRLSFPGGTTPPAGEVKDLGGGPLGVDGHIVMLQDKPGVNLDLFLTTHPNTPQSLVENLQFLAPDAQGRRELQTEFGF
jgi:Type II secretion system (T2SS), protein N